MLENGLLLIQIIVFGWVIAATVKFELKSKKSGGNPPAGDADG